MTTITALPERIISICDAFLQQLDALQPEIEARCAEVEAAEEVAHEEACAAWRQKMDEHSAVTDQEAKAWEAWSRALPFFRGPAPIWQPRLPPWPPQLVSASPRSAVSALRARVTEMRARGRLACAAVTVTADEAVALDRWESGVEMERVRKMIETKAVTP